MSKEHSITKVQIRTEIYTAFENLGAGHELLSIIGSWTDTMDDEDILSMLIGYNRGEPLFDNIISQA